MAVSQSDYFLKPGETPEQYNVRIAQLRGDTPESLASMQTATAQAQPSVISSAPAKQEVAAGKQFLNNLLLISPPGPISNAPPQFFAPSPFLNISTSNQGTQNVVGEINRLLNTPEVKQALPESLRNQIAGIQGIEATNQGLIGQAQTAADNNQFQLFSNLIQQIKDNQAKRDTELANLQSGFAPLREKYLASLLPTQEEKDIGTQLADLRKKQQEFQLSLEQGQQTQFGLGRPLALSTGRAQELERQAGFQKRQMQIDEANLLTRLGLAQKARELESGVRKEDLSFALQDLNFRKDVYDRQEQRENQVFNQAIQLNTVQRQNYADILDNLKGIDPEKFSPDDQAKLANIAASRGITYSSLVQGLQVQYDRDQLDIKTKQLGLQKTQAEIEKLGEKEKEKYLTSAEYNKLEAVGIDKEFADALTAEILLGVPLDQIREKLRKNGVDPVVLDRYDNVVGIDALLKVKTLSKSSVG